MEKFKVIEDQKSIKSLIRNMVICDTMINYNVFILYGEDKEKIKSNKGNIIRGNIVKITLSYCGKFGLVPNTIKVKDEKDDTKVINVIDIKLFANKLIINKPIKTGISKFKINWNIKKIWHQFFPKE